MRWLFILALVGCSNDVDPRVIAGGGISDGEIDGEVNVHLIDNQTNDPIANASVTIGETTKTTDAKGLVTFSDVEGSQTIAAKATGYRSAVWAEANGANITIPLAPQVASPESATLSGTIAGYSAISVAQGHVKAAAIVYSHTTGFGDRANEIATPGMANLCIAVNDCNWSVVSRTGSVSLLAVIVDSDLMGTPFNRDDDVTRVIGYAYKSGITVSAGVNQSGLVLDQIEAGNLETVTMDPGTPPAGLPDVIAFPGIEVGGAEVIQLPLFLLTEDLEVLVPKRSVFSGTATYRLTAIAQTPSAGAGAQSFILRQGLTMPGELTAGEWLVPPVGVEASRTTASWDPVDGAALHTVIWSDGTNELLEISVFSRTEGMAEVPNAVALPTSGTLTAKVQAIGTDFDLNDFSLEDDSDLVWGVAIQPTTIP